MDHILCKRRLLRHYFESVWVILGGWDNNLGGWSWVGMYGALFWVGGGGREYILVDWGWMGWVGVSEGGWRWVGVGALFDNAHNKQRISYFRTTHAIWTMITKQPQKTQTTGYMKYQQLCNNVSNVNYYYKNVSPKHGDFKREIVTQ